MHLFVVIITSGVSREIVSSSSTYPINSPELLITNFILFYQIKQTTLVISRPYYSIFKGKVILSKAKVLEKRSGFSLSKVYFIRRPTVGLKVLCFEAWLFARILVTSKCWSIVFSVIFEPKLIFWIYYSFVSWDIKDNKGSFNILDWNKLFSGIIWLLSMLITLSIVILFFGS